MRTVVTKIRSCFKKTLKQGLHEKANGDQVQQVKTAVAGAQTQIASTEEALQEKADKNHVNQLRSTLTSLEAKLAGVEASMQEKVAKAVSRQLE